MWVWVWRLEYVGTEGNMWAKRGVGGMTVEIYLVGGERDSVYECGDGGVLERMDAALE